MIGKAGGGFGCEIQRPSAVSHPATAANDTRPLRFGGSATSSVGLLPPSEDPRPGARLRRQVGLEVKAAPSGRLLHSFKLEGPPGTARRLELHRRRCRRMLRRRCFVADDEAYLRGIILHRAAATVNWHPGPRRTMIFGRSTGPAPVRLTVPDSAGRRRWSVLGASRRILDPA